MNIKVTLFLFTTFISIAFYVLWHPIAKVDIQQPKPFETEIDGDNPDEALTNYRLKWEDRIHSTSSNMDWKLIEKANKADLLKHRADLKSKIDFRVTDENIGGGRLLGKWKENGSTNLAGSVIATAYDTINQEIFLISAGGSLFKGNINTMPHINWKIIDDDQRFDGYTLKCLYLANKKLRLIAAPNGIPSYSDNHGNSWKTSKGISLTNNGKKYIHDFIQTSSNQLYLIAKSNEELSEYKIYHSSNLGETYKPIYTFHSKNEKEFKLSAPHNSNEAIFIHKSSTISKLYTINNGDIRYRHSSQFPLYGDARVNVTGCKYLNQTYLYIYQIESINPPKVNIYNSKDGGVNWQIKGSTTHLPFKVGLYVFPNNPNRILLGGVECHISNDGGKTFNSKNKWTDYYKNPQTQLHADMMYFNFMQNKHEDPFLLISNHGGIYLSFDELISCENIGRNNLNVSQFYSVATKKNNSKFFFAGSQDQGLQRAIKRNQQYEFKQLISGDFGDIIFTENNKRMWSIMPGGTVFYWENPYHEFDYSPSWFINTYSDEKKIWIPQLVKSYNVNENEIFIARNDGTKKEFNYSHIIKLKHQDKPSKKIDRIDYKYNFTSNSSGGELTTFSFHSAESSQWIAGTSNGHIFYSDDYWRNWKKSEIIDPLSYEHFYIHKTLFSETDDEIFVVGSGYSNSPILISYDGGVSFESMQGNLPSTTIFDIELIEGLIFIATENGPWVFFRDLNKWFTLTGFDGPLQSYRAIEYLTEDNKKIVRFGTFGRGMWDFNIDRINSVIKPKSINKISAFPNPATNWIKFNLPTNQSYNISIFSIDGKLVKKAIISSEKTYDISYLKKGSYFIQLSNKELNFVSKLIKQ